MELSFLFQYSGGQLGKRWFHPEKRKGSQTVSFLEGLGQTGEGDPKEWRLLLLFGDSPPLGGSLPLAWGSKADVEREREGVLAWHHRRKLGEELSFHLVDKEGEKTQFLTKLIQHKLAFKTREQEETKPLGIQRHLGQRHLSFPILKCTV